MKKTDRFSDRDETLFLIDISSFIFRAFFAIRALKNSSGEPTNAVYGVATMLAKLVQECDPRFVMVAYDSKEPSFRKEMYSEYKANRSAPPDDLIPQFDRIEELIASLEFPAIRQNGVEADDLIASLADQWVHSSPKHRVVIVSGDKDLMQLVSDRICVWDTMKDTVYRAKEVQDKFGVRPDQVRDYLALVGDSSDNIPGVPSIGPKSAADLLTAHETLEGILKAARAGKIAGKKGEVIQAHEKDALLSQKLATVKRDLKVPVDRDGREHHFRLTDAAARLLKELEFHSLLKQWSETFPGTSTKDSASEPSEGVSTLGGIAKSHPTPKGVHFRAIRTEEELKSIVAELKKAGEFGFDLETTSLNPREAKICGVALATKESEGVYIPIGHHGDAHQLETAHVLATLKPLLEDARYKKVGQNLKYDFSVLSEHGLKPDGIGADTMIADYLLDSDARHSLEALAQKHFGYEVVTYEEICGKGKNQISFADVPVETATRYSAEDAWMALKLWRKMAPELKEWGALRVFSEIELPLVQVLMRMELAGVSIDEPYLAKLSKEFEHDLERIQKKIGAYTKEPINLNSPKQLAVLLFEELKLPVQSKTKTGYSTDASVLEVLSSMHEVPRLLLEYREIAKLKGTYVDPLPILRDAKTGRIHGSFHQTVAATGRLSSSDPNLQNIPIRTERGKKIRRAFIPRKGNVLLSADYSQIELRILAHMCGDPALIDAFRSQDDIHRRTAAEIFSVAPSAVDSEMRSVAKAINFGLIYGKTAFGLSQELKIPRKQAAEFIERYFKRYSKVKGFLDSLIEGAREKGYVETLAGRRRTLRDIQSSNAAIRANAERMAMNAPIQGTAADMMKLAMIEIDHQLLKHKMKSQMIIQVHDEVVLDCDPKEVKDVEHLVVKAMQEAMKLDVPLDVNVGTGSNWEET